MLFCPMALNLKLSTRLFKLFTDPARLRIVRLLHERPVGLCGCELSSALKIPQYTISRHLQALKSAGLLSSRRIGTWVYYSLKEGQLPDSLIHFLFKDVDDSILEKDRQRLEERLLLREEGKCTVGFVSEKELKRRIRSKKTCC